MTDTSSIKKIDINKTDWRSSREFFQSLEDELRSLDDKDEKYDFTWVGKRKAIIEAGAPINKTLRPDEKSSKNWDTTENLFIEGDNLDALKLLQESYLGKVKMIYIDPPYNTGKDFVYHDNFKASTEEYDKATEYKDEEGNIQFKKNERSNGRYHSDWLSMMYPRLKLARNLLASGGAIFISIDNNEHDNLKKICDEIFGEENFIDSIVWDKKSSAKGVPPQNMMVNVHEYILVYQKDNNFKFIGEQRTEESGKFKNPDNDSRGPWRESNIKSTTKPIEDAFTIVDPNTGKEYTNTWAFSKDSLERMIKEERILWKDTLPKQKEFMLEMTNENMAIKSNWGVFDPQSTTVLLKQMIPDARFDNPKPLALMDYLIKVATEKDTLVLDFFAGSGTTAHAVMKLNAEDGGNRKWIMVQLPEETPEGSEARKAGYATIPDIARERIRRAGDKIAKEHPDAKVDYGFRSLVVADTSFKDVYKPVSEVSQASLLETVDNIKEDRKALDLLYSVLVQLALELNRPIETRDISGSTVYLYDYLGEVSGLAACFSEKVSEDAIKHIASLKPLTAVFRDSSFVDSQAKVNLAEHFRVISPDTKVRVI